MQVLNGAKVKYQGQWEASDGSTFLGGLGARNANDLLHDVTAGLQKDGIVVSDSSNDATFLQQHSLPFFGAGTDPFHVTLSLTINNGVGFGSEQDVMSLVDHEVYVASGKLPVSSVIVTVTNPNNVAVQTGTPQQSTPPNSPSLWDSIKSLFSDSKILIVGIGVGLVVSVLMISAPRR